MSLKDAIQNHFGSDYAPFFHRFFEDLKPGGAGNLKARCPFHDDQTASLSIGIRDGRWNCKACGSKGDAFSFYARKHGLDTKASFPEVLRGIAEAFSIHGGNGTGKAAERQVVKAYDYLDAAGNVVFRKLRYEPKSFSLCQPNGAGGWINGMAGVEPVLYRLPEIMAATEVWVAEGEKDADSLAGLGFAATTNFDGAGKWKDTYAEILRGKHVFIIPDNDEPGRQHAELVARSLHGKAESVKNVTLPGLPDKGDVSDFIAGIGDPDAAAERLSLMADCAAEWTPEAESKTIQGQAEQSTATHPRFQFIHNADILSDLRPVEWRIRDILTDYALYYNFGDPGHFKTFIELDRLLCIASGIDYHGHKVKQGTVFYIAGEGQQGIGRRIAAWHIAHGTKAADVPFFVSKTPTQLMDLEAVEDVRRAVDSMAKKYGLPAVVHIDTLARNFGPGDENATKDMNAGISNLDHAFGADFCRGLTHHTGHGNKERARGSIALHGAADAAFRICLSDTGQIVAECKKQKDAPAAPMMIFERREILLQIGATEDRSYVLDLIAEGDEACGIVKPKRGGELKGGLQSALNILRRLYARYEDNLRKSGRSCATPSVSFTDWRTACMDAGLYKRTDNFRTAAEKILLHGLIRMDEAKKYVYLVEMVNEDKN